MVMQYLEERMLIADEEEKKTVAEFLKLSVFSGAGYSSEEFITYILDFAKFAREQPLYKDFNYNF